MILNRLEKRSFTTQHVKMGADNSSNSCGCHRDRDDHVGDQCDERSKVTSVSRRPGAWLQVSELGDLGERRRTRASRERAQIRRTPPNGRLSRMLALLILIVNSVNFLPAAEGVDCFKCSSRNGSNPLCEDPFHNTNTTRVTTPILPEPHPNVIYHTPCYAGKKGRDGLFPASACIKLTGIFDKTGETLVVRHCALDSGSLTQDTELARMSHCGKFQFEGDLLRGCVLACPEDACNSASSLTQMLQTRNGPLPLIIMWLLSVSLSVCLIHWP